MRRIVCGWLASALCVVRRPSPYADIRRDDPEDLGDDEGFVNQVRAAAQPAGATTAFPDPILVDIRALLRKKARIEEEEGERLRDESKVRQDWMLAARVFNRICFVFFAITLFVVTAGFFVIFHSHH